MSGMGGRCVVGCRLGAKVEWGVGVRGSVLEFGVCGFGGWIQGATSGELARGPPKAGLAASSL